MEVVSQTKRFQAHNAWTGGVMIIIKRLGSPRKETRKVYNIIFVYVGVRTTPMRPLRLTVITTLYTTIYTRVLLDGGVLVFSRQIFKLITAVHLSPVRSSLNRRFTRYIQDDDDDSPSRPLPKL